MIDKYECPLCKKYDDVFHDVIDLELWMMFSICDNCFELDGGTRYLNNADIEGLTAEVKRLCEGIMFFLEIDRQPSRAELLELIE
mgnify:CR=1 FL=1|tara:strand:+ start:817 stop:1071 length:255 start_codon:yes stop_codon:yes gene_type:complete